MVHYGYWAVGVALLLENVGMPVPGETVLLMASFVAYSQHELQLRGSFWWGYDRGDDRRDLGFALG